MTNCGKTNLSHDGLNPAHVPYWWVNNPTLGEFCFTMIGRADIEGSKSNVAMNAWLPQASYPCGNFSDTSSFKFRRTKGSIGHAFTVRIRTGNQNQTSFYPFVPHEISVLVELILGHLRYLLTDVPPQPNSPPDNVFRPDRPAEADLGPGLGHHRNPRRSMSRVDRRTGSHRSTSDRDTSPAPIRFPPDNFKHSLTLFSKSFSSFPRGTCSLSVSRQYLALDGIYRPIGAAFPNNPTRRQRLVVRQGPGTTGLSPSLAPPSRGLGPGPPLRTLLQTTIRTPRATDFHGGLFPVRSPLLRESLLVSFPPLIDMLKLSRRALGLMASGATCVQRLDGSRDSAIHTKYRISLRSSSMQEPRYPLPRVILFVFHKSKNFTSDYEIRMPPTVPVNHYSDPEGQHNRIRILWCYPMLMYTERRLALTGITAAAGTRLALQWILVKGFRLYSFQLPDSMSPGRNLNDASPAQRPCDPTSYHESSKQQAEPVLTFYLINASLPEVGVCCTY
uniref:Senescence-associated protein n=1 Tax=Glycine max TaxID=3847 RepID=A0A0R0GH48_SOYBN